MAVELWRNCGGYTGIIALPRCDRGGSKGLVIHHKGGPENGGRNAVRCPTNGNLKYAN